MLVDKSDVNTACYSTKVKRGRSLMTSHISLAFDPLLLFQTILTKVYVLSSHISCPYPKDVTSFIDGPIELMLKQKRYRLV